MQQVSKSIPNNNLSLLTLLLFLIYPFVGQTIIFGFLLMAGLLIWQTKFKLPKIDAKFGLCLLGFVILNITNSLSKSLATITFIQTIAIGFLLYYVIHKDKIYFSPKILTGCFVTTSSILLIEHNFDYFFTRQLADLEFYNNRLDKFSFLYTISSPFIISLATRNKAIIYSALYLVTVLTMPMVAARVALFASLIFMCGFYLTKDKFIKFTINAISAFLICVPLIYGLFFAADISHQLYHSVKNSWQLRLEMWEKAILVIREYPIFGIGINNTKILDSHTEIMPNIVMQVHPHNGYIQLWLETGFVGVLFAVYLLKRLEPKLVQLKDQRQKLLIMMLIGSLASFNLMSFNIWAPWMLGAIATSLLFVFSTSQK